MTKKTFVMLCDREDVSSVKFHTFCSSCTDFCLGGSRAGLIRARWAGRDGIMARMASGGRLDILDKVLATVDPKEWSEVRAPARPCQCVTIGRRYGYFIHKERGDGPRNGVMVQGTG